MRWPSHELFLLLMLAFWAVCFVYGRRKLMATSYPAHFRMRIMKCVLPLLMVMIAAVVLKGRADGKTWGIHNWLILLALVLITFSFWWTWMSIRPQLAEEQKRMLAQPAISRPTFVWQGLLILTPVALLTVMGVLSLRWDRAAAEDDARENAAALLQRLEKAFRAPYPSFSQYPHLRDSWRAQCATEAGATGSWSDASPNAYEKARSELETWNRDHPDIDLARMPAGEIRFDENGLLTDPAEIPHPSPAEWFHEMNAAQRFFWNDAQASEAAKRYDDALASLKNLLALNPSLGVRANAEFHLLRLKTRDLPPDKAAQQFIEAPVYNNIKTESGLPLREIHLHHALRLLPDGSGIPEKWKETFTWTIHGWEKSFFTGEVFREGERVAGTNNLAAARAMRALKALWKAEERTREVAQAFVEQHPDAPLHDKGFWFESSSGTFLADMKLRPVSTNADAQNYTVRLYPDRFVQSYVSNLVEKSSIDVPAYAALSLKLGGRELPPASSNSVLSARVELASHLVRLNDPNFNTPMEMKISLVTPDLLYARQQQRALWFGSLIVLAAGAALVGFVSARRAFYRQLRLSELKSNFVSSVSHELRAPIASVRLMAEGLERGKISEPAKQKEYFRFIGQECRRLSSLIENVLNFSRIEQGRQQYEFEPTDILKLVGETVRVMDPYASEKNVKLNWTLGTGDDKPAATTREEHGRQDAYEKSDQSILTSAATPVVDGRAIQQALINLIDNAVKHSPHGATVLVTLKTQPGSSRREEAHSSRRGDQCLCTSPATHGETLCLSVEDAGPGIPKSEQEKIFERFYRLGSELRRETQGVGIGLSIVKHIAQAHRGRVVVESEPGKGSRFTIEIPLKQPVQDESKKRI